MMKFLLSPKGRVHRMTFTYAWAILIGLMFVLNFFITTPFVLLLPLVLFVVTVKRLHDINLNGFYTLIIYQVYGLFAMQENGMTEISIFSYNVTMATLIYYMMWPTFIALFYLGVKRGDNNVNRYGTNPSWKVVPRVPLTEFLSWRGIALRTGEKHK
ncbi:MAG: uncharacterized membrane protein YhaH (DUF805 family) [Alphaproteobacteria bacterium]|jgi:uncharacterized membrane protein YhaH (DUF805 family)